MSGWNWSEDDTAPGSGSQTNFLTSYFENAAGDDYRLKDSTPTLFEGAPLVHADAYRNVRRMISDHNYFFPGFHDPDPEPVWPAEISVVDGIEYGPTGDDYTGRWQKAVATSYEDGETFGIDGTSETGTYVTQTPDTPTWSADPTAGDGQLTVYLTAGDATDVLYVFYKAQSSTMWLSAGHRIGSGSLTKTGLTNAVEYEFIAVARNGGVYSRFSNLCEGTPVGSPTPVSLSDLNLRADVVTDDLTCLVTQS